MARSHGQFLLNILRRFETVFQTTILHSCQRCLRVPVSPLPHQHLLLSGFSYYYSYPAKWVLFEHCGLSSISQNTNDTEGYVLTTQVSTPPSMLPRPDSCDYVTSLHMRKKDSSTSLLSIKIILAIGSVSFRRHCIYLFFFFSRMHFRINLSLSVEILLTIL